MIKKNYNSADFIKFALDKNILKFGEFTTKAGRASPYFFNAGLFYDGESLSELAKFYAYTILANKINYDMLFGPAYKGITLASATSCALHSLGHNKNFAFNRKEEKKHGEGGNIIGAPLIGRVLIIDDVISAGTSIKQAIEIIQNAGATVAGVIVAMDRMEKSGTNLVVENYTAIQEIENLGIKVFAIANLKDIINYSLKNNIDSSQEQKIIEKIKEYQKKYCVI